MKKNIALLLSSFVFSLVLAPGLACAANSPAAPLPDDPKIKEGVLPNGMHYIIRPNNTPAGQVSIWLHINTGSIDETDKERGLAHYLEHMAFDGTEHFPPGAMTARLREMGLTVGVHQNAFTSFDQTTFQLNLPNTAPDSLKTALLCLSDIACRMTVPPDQIEKEKKIVLEELRSIAGANHRTMKQALGALFANDKLGQRDVIGTEETIKAFTRQQVLDFYHRGYRPEKATLLIVGDIKPDDLAKLIPTYFADWKDAAPQPAPEQQTAQTTTVHEKLVTDPEVATANVSIFTKAPPKPLKTEADYRSLLVAKLANWMVQTRLETQVEKGGAPFQHSDVDASNFMDFSFLNSATLVGDPQKWREILTAFVTECHRVGAYGFSGQEMADARTALLAENQREALTLETRDSTEIMREYNEAVTERSNLAADTHLLELAQKLLPTITPQEVQAYFTRTFDPQKWLLLVTLPDKTAPLPSAADIHSLVTAAMNAPVQPLAAYRRVASILEKDPAAPAHGPSAFEHDADLDVTSATLANAVVVNYHPLASIKNEIHLKLTLPGGEITETAANRGITQLVASCLNQTATARLSSVEMKRILNGKNIDFYASADPDALTINITTTPENLEDAFRLLHAVLNSARLENSAVENWRDRMRLQLQDEKTNIGAAQMWALRAAVYANDVRRAQVPLDNINNLTLDDAQKWADQLLHAAPLEVGIVGDATPQRVLDLAGRYLGSLPQRPVMKDYFTQQRQLQLKDGTQVKLVQIPTVTDKAIVSVAYRSASIWDHKDVNALQILTYIVQNRIREKVREEQGLTYTATVFCQPGEPYPDAGLFLIYLTCDPAKADHVAQLCQQVVDDMVKNGITQTELDEASKQYLNSWKTEEYDADYWLDRLARLKYSGWNLDWMKKSADQVTQTKNMETIRNVAAKYLVPERRMTVMGCPGGPA
jgi:zinc protease